MNYFVPLLLLATCCGPCMAQQAPSALLEANASARPLPDSVRQAVHQLFKRGRLWSAVGGVSGGMVLGSGVTYAAKDGMTWQPLVDILLGGTALAGGLTGRAHYSRRREKQTLAALAQGYPLPPYVAEVALLLPKKNRQLILRNISQ